MTALPRCSTASIGFSFAMNCERSGSGIFGTVQVPVTHLIRESLKRIDGRPLVGGDQDGSVHRAEVVADKSDALLVNAGLLEEHVQGCGAGPSRYGRKRRSHQSGFATGTTSARTTWSPAEG